MKKVWQKRLYFAQNTLKNIALYATYEKYDYERRLMTNNALHVIIFVNTIYKKS